MISVCIVTRERHEQLAACLLGLRDQVNVDDFEVLVVADRDPASVDVVLEHFPSAATAVIEDANLGAARNALLTRASGDVLLFLDDDVVPAPGMLARLGDLARDNPDVGVFGGPNVTPHDSGRFEQVQGHVLASAIAAGPVSKRYRLDRTVEASERDLTLCNLAVRRSLMVPFPSDVLGGEENAVLEELHRNGVRMLADPGLAVEHGRRGTWAGLATQMLKYGRGRGQIMRRDRRTTHAVYLIPVAFVAYLVSLPALASVQALAVLPLLTYLVMAGLTSAAIAMQQDRSLPAFAQAAGMIGVVHLAYGAGVAVGVAERPTYRGSNPQVSWITVARQSSAAIGVNDSNRAI